MNENSIKILEEFLNNNDDLEQLESIANEFNIFSSLGIINTEIRHSRFLSWLLNPKESHGLGEYYLKSFLKNVVFNSGNILNVEFEQPSIFEIDEFDLDDLEVYTEWKSIDILLKDEKNRLNPRNGICLNSIHDKAFDKGYITITPEFKVKLSPIFNEYKRDNSIKDLFLQYDNKEITLPDKFLPSREFLDFHYQKIFRK